MSLEETYEVERTKWDDLASHGLPKSSIVPSGENFYTYADRAATMVGVREFLGDLEGKKVLEYGCGLGQLSVLLAKTGAEVTAFDLSEKSVKVTRNRAILNDVSDNISVAVAAGEALPFEDESFDVIFGKSILHHLDADLSAYDLSRVLKTGGKAAFSEPLGMNPFLKIARDHVPYPQKNPRGADIPLDFETVHKWGQYFDKFHYHNFQLLSMLERGLGFKKRLTVLRRADDILLKNFPFLQRYCRSVVLFMEK